MNNKDILDLFSHLSKVLDFQDFLMSINSHFQYRHLIANLIATIANLIANFSGNISDIPPTTFNIKYALCHQFFQFSSCAFI